MFERFLEFAIGSSIDIDVPPDYVWSVMSDIDNFPKIFWNVTKVERLDGSKVGSAIVVGSRYRIHRQTRQKERYFADWTVTALEPGWSITFCSHNIASEGMTSSTTWAVAPAPPQEIEDVGMGKSIIRRLSGTLETITRRRSSNVCIDDLAALEAADDAAKKSEEASVPVKSVATITLAIIPTKLFLIAGRLMCCCVYKQRALSSTEEDLEDMATGAKKLFAEPQKNKVEFPVDTSEEDSSE